MAMLTEWVRQLVVLVFVVSAAQLLLPTDDMRPYVRFVLGLIIVGSLLSSALDFTEFDFDFRELLSLTAAPTMETELIERGHGLTAAALVRIEGYEGVRERQRAEQLAAVVLGEAPRHVTIAGGNDGSMGKVTVVRGAMTDVGDAEASRMLARLLGLEPHQVEVVGEEGNMFDDI